MTATETVTLTDGREVVVVKDDCETFEVKYAREVLPTAAMLTVAAASFAQPRPRRQRSSPIPKLWRGGVRRQHQPGNQLRHARHGIQERHRLANLSLPSHSKLKTSGHKIAKALRKQAREQEARS